jgi:hypothetical protein
MLTIPGVGRYFAGTTRLGFCTCHLISASESVNTIQIHFVRSENKTRAEIQLLYSQAQRCRPCRVRKTRQDAKRADLTNQILPSLLAHYIFTCVWQTAAKPNRGGSYIALCRQQFPSPNSSTKSSIFIKIATIHVPGNSVVELTTTSATCRRRIWSAMISVCFPSSEPLDMTLSLISSSHPILRASKG